MVEYEIADEDSVRISEAKYSHDNGVDVRIHISSDGEYAIGGCQWPAEWSDRAMKGETYSDEQIEEWKRDALQAADKIVSRYNEE